MAPIHQLSAREIAAGVHEKKFSAKEVATSSLTAIKKLNGQTNAYLTILEKEALLQAEAVDKKIASGAKAGKLAGVPVALKDNLMLTGARTTCASAFSMAPITARSTLPLPFNRRMQPLT